MEFDFKQIAENVRNKSYKFLGSGSGRSVFDLDNGYVVKVAKNLKGLAQNKTEYKIAKDSGSELFAKIPEISENFELLIMEKAEKLEDFSLVFKYFNVRNHGELFYIKQFRDLPEEFGLLPIDLVRRDSWGTIEGRPVIIDYGFTLQVRNRYYFPF